MLVNSEHQPETSLTRPSTVEMRWLFSVWSAGYTRRAGAVLSIGPSEEKVHWSELCMKGGTECTTTSGRVACFVWAEYSCYVVYV